MLYRTGLVHPDTAAWLADELSLVLVEDAADGSAQLLVGDRRVEASTLAEIAGELANLSPDEPALAMLIERARAGEAGTLDVDGGRLLAWCEHAGRARILFAPARDVVMRRAAAADLAAGVTHEVANALTAIAGWTRMAESVGPLPDRTRQALTVVQRSAKDALGAARGLLRTMRDAGRQTIVPSREHENVSAVVGEVIETLRPELEEAGIAVETDLAKEAWGPTAPSALRLVIGNLVRNAFEALSAGGHVRISVKNSDERICLSVADDGPGMSAQTLAHVFDRYFTTKEHGTGLGLALVRDTVNEAGGRVEVVSQMGVGTRFDIWLPAAKQRRMGARKRKARTASSGIHPRPALAARLVLVVDDDEAIRSMVRTALELQGAQVRTAAGCAEARATQGTFALALVDLSLADGRGDELIAELRATGKIERAILLTGSPDADLDPHGTPDILLRKPFELEELARLIEALLGGAGLEAEA